MRSCNCSGPPDKKLLSVISKTFPAGVVSLQFLVKSMVIVAPESGGFPTVAAFPSIRHMFSA